MPSSYNLDRTVGAQLSEANRTSQGYQNAIIEESQDPRQIAPHVTTGMAGVQSPIQAEFENFMLTVAVEAPVDLSGFNQITHNAAGSNSNAPTITTTAAGTTTTTINQTLLLTGRP
ncbi:hypothetical protein FBU30_004888 [Linnemannia zychae]|nr:hypothetical protein FBU30_004888 [Linnemannia zychae]